jgi:tail length tape measure protein
MAELDLNVNVDVKGQSKLSGLGKNLGQAGMHVAKFAAGAGVAALGAAAGLTALAAEAEKSSALLEASFKNMGKTSGKSLDQLKEQATALGEATTFDDEGIMEAQAALLSFGAVSGKAFDRALEGAADYAAATDTDLTTATKSFGKALADPVKGLSRLARAGIVFTDQQEEQVKKLVESGDTLGAQNIILEGIESRYKGVNEALSNTAAGEAAQALEDLENAGEDIGSIFLPILAAAAKGVQAFAHFIQDNMPTIKAVVGTVMGAVGAAFSFVANEIIPRVISAFSGVGSSTSVIGTVVNVISTQVLPFLVSAFQKVIGFLQENWPTISSIFRQVFGAVAAAVKVIWPIVASIAQVLFPMVLTAAGVLLKVLDTTFKAIGGVFEVAGNVASAVVDGITAAWKVLSSVTTSVWEGISGIITGSINAVIDVINGFFGFLNGLSFGAGPWDVGPIHVDAIAIDPFNIPLIPHLAEGGIIRSPTLALLGEAGPEAVVPLNRAQPSVQRIINLEIQAPLRANDAEDIAEYIDRVERLEKAMEWTGA